MNQDFSNRQDPIIQKNMRRRKFPLYFWTILIIFLVLCGVVFAKAYNFSSKVFVSRTSVWKKIENVVFHGSANAVIGESDGRINVLLLGYGGPGHDGPYLTDTIILASIEPDQKKIILTSIPRDYYDPALQQKINYAYAAGFAKHNDPEEAGEAATQAVSQLTGLDIPYFASVDFAGFEKAIDAIGGIDITVDNAFTDSQFPNDANSGYIAPLVFNVGTQHMGGKTALEFARSRHGTNGEDSDFARSKRQEKVIQAFETKLKQQGFNPKTINNLLGIIADDAHTNLDPNEVLHLADMVRGNDYAINSQSFDISTNLVCEQIDPSLGYILRDCPGINSGDIQNFFKNGIDQVKQEAASAIVENAGNDPQAYTGLILQLKNKGLDVYPVPYKGLPLEQSALYEVNNKPATISYLESQLGVQAQPKPSSMTAKTDLVIFFVPR